MLFGRLLGGGFTNENINAPAAADRFHNAGTRHVRHRLAPRENALIGRSQARLFATFFPINFIHSHPLSPATRMSNTEIRVLVAQLSPTDTNTLQPSLVDQSAGA